MFFRAAAPVVLTLAIAIGPADAQAGSATGPVSPPRPVAPPGVPRAAAQARSEAPRRAVEAFDALFGGPHAGARPVHAKGLLLEGLFTPTPAAEGLSQAPHFRGSEHSILVRFSTFAGLPAVSDSGSGAGPRGAAIKFALPDGGDTDLVMHSYDGFPAATPEDFVAFLRSAANPDPSALAGFLAAHPAAARFARDAMPAPEGFATERYFGVNAFVFTNAAGRKRHGRYRLEPVAGAAYLDAPAAAAPGYLREEMVRRLAAGPARMRLIVQLAGPGDDVADGSVPWPRDREEVEVGIVALSAVAPDDGERQRGLLFSPLNLTTGISPSADPLLAARSRAYAIAFARRARPEGHAEATGLPLPPGPPSQELATSALAVRP